jgi:PTH1 family peptidyl-tRNA hydrolase
MLDRLEELFKKIRSHEEHHKPISYIVAGLGNPGPKYAATRHNAGFWMLDKLAEKYGVKVDKGRFDALTGEAVISGERVLLLKPMTFMNLSGKAVSAAAAFYKIPMERVLVVFDDISLPPSKMRIRKKGSAGGHNGIKSILEYCGTEEFPRIKIGVGDKPKDWDLADYVLSRFQKEEQEAVREALKETSEACHVMITSGIEAAMNLYNKKK